MGTFISYTSHDKLFADWLARTLTDNGVSVWYDRWEIRVGDSIVRKVTDGLRESDSLIVVLSRAAMMSPWVQEEVSAALMQAVDGAKGRLLPVLIEECDLPPLLSHRRYANFSADRTAALAELLEALVPGSEIRGRLAQKRDEFMELLRRLQEVLPVPGQMEPGSDQENHLFGLLMNIESCISSAMSLRFQLEACRDHALLVERPTFYTRFNSLLSKGLQIRSQGWADLRQFRNLMAHGPSDENGNLIRARQALAQIEQLESVMAELTRSPA